MRSRRFVAICVGAATLAVAAPAGADCVTMGAYVQTFGGTPTYVLPDGTCVVPTPWTTFQERRRSAGITGVAEVGVSVGVPFPLIDTPTSEVVERTK